MSLLKFLNKKRVKFLKDIPSFYGVDGKEYGPFNKGDITLLPSQNAEVFERKGYVTIID